MTPEERDKLVKDNQDLVRNIAFGVYRGISGKPAFDFDDLVGWGEIGLIEAAETYDETRRDFPSWAYMRVRGAMIDGLRSLDLFPRQLYEMRRDIINQAEELTAQLGRDPEHREVADALEMTDESYRTWMGRIRQMEVMSTESTYNDSEHLEDRCDYFGEWEVSCDLMRAIRLLRQRERNVIYYTYWMGLTNSETAKKLGINPSRVHQIKQDALRALRERMGDGQE